MKNLFPILLLITLFFTSCDDESKNQYASIRSIDERVNELGLSLEEIKLLEDNNALIKSQNNLLEYEYPIRQDEAYVIVYLFKKEICSEIRFKTYLNKSSDAKKIVQQVLFELRNNSNFKKLNQENSQYNWTSLDGGINIMLDIQGVERGHIGLTISTF